MVRQRQPSSGIPLIEDAAQARGTLIAGRPAGTLGAAGCFSTHDRKLLSTGEGGFILTDDGSMAASVEAFTRLGHLRSGQPAVNYKLAAPLAAIGLARLDRINQQVKARTANARRLLDALGGHPDLPELCLADGGKPNYYSLVLIASGDPEQTSAAFTRSGLPPDTMRWNYLPLHRRPLLAARCGRCPNADELARRAIQLPVHPGLSEPQLQSIISRLSVITQQIGTVS